ncbi:hypothetical protein ASPTUDRAFT_919145 [Aspergillus tubingensis CBS 134.48]|uniref:Uncharacterized protein n=1 Tax=Aspergillus tubingensis (strain CBS 134.48) TaxID=767770 RepID=A0A1L9NIS6_ASPTC|nr:hypothetical protein ASPTUDRAFT_919145 [Aspergillus tubingensis CBS 134.48]
MSYPGYYLSDLPVELVFECDEDDVKFNHDGPSSLLDRATYYKDVEMVKILLQNGADPGLPCTRGGPPGTFDSLLGFTENICPQMAEALLDAGATPFSLAYVIGPCRFDGPPSSLIDLVLKNYMKMHSTYSGRLGVTDFTDATILHYAASEGTPDLLEAIISRAPNLLHAGAIGWTSCCPDKVIMPGQDLVPNVDVPGSWYDLYSPLNLALGSHKGANAKYLLQCGSKVDIGSFKCVWEQACEWTKFTPIWVEVLELMAAKIDFDTPHNTPMIQWCIDFFFHKKACHEKRFIQNLCLPSFLGNMSLRTRAQYLDKFYVESYQEHLDELRYIIAWCEVALQNETQLEGKTGISARDEPTGCPPWLACFRKHEKARQEIVELLWEAMLDTESPTNLSGLVEGRYA